MFWCMRTTIYLPDELLSEVKKIAVESKSTLTAVIEDALRELLAWRVKQSQTVSVRLTTFGKRGPNSGIDIDDPAALLDLMEESSASDSPVNDGRNDHFP